MLYYHARYYDPTLGRFLSADSVVPGSASGGMDGVALKPLTVDFHEPGFVSKLNGENNQPFWFQMRDAQRQKAGSAWGPSNPQALNRYSYVQNNPLKYTDPSGHVVLNKQEAKAFDRLLTDEILPALRDAQGLSNLANGGIGAIIGGALGAILPAALGIGGLAGSVVGGGLGNFLGSVLGYLTSLGPDWYGAKEALT